MIRQRKPLKRSWLKFKRRVRKDTLPWKPDQIHREDAAGMIHLRHEAWQRSGGLCECNGRQQSDGWGPVENPVPCKERVSWLYGNNHHIRPRAHGGSDVIENMEYISWVCHKRITGDLQWGKRSRDGRLG